MLRETEKSTGRAKRHQSSGENQRDSRRVRECRDFEAAVNKGHRNKAIEEFLRK